MIRLGLVGTGAWGRRYIDTAKRRDDARVVALARASARTYEGAPELPVVGSHQALLERCVRGELDALIVATTPEHQAEVVAACIEARVPVLSEKPLGHSRAAAERLHALWRAQGAQSPVMVDMVHLWSPAFRELERRVAQAGGVQAVHSISAAGCATGPFRGWSSLYDYGPHDASMLVQLCGARAPVQVSSCVRSVSPDVPQGELFEVRCEVDSIPVHAWFGNGSRHKQRRFAVRLRDGHELLYDDMQPHPHKLSLDGQPVEVATTMPLDAALEDFIARVDAFRHDEPRADSRGDLACCVAVQGLLDALVARCRDADPAHASQP